MNKDLTAGKPEKVLWQFCLPLFGSIIFQQLYNIADSFVAGKFISDNALAAVGNSYEITLIFIAFAFGCNIACSVIAALFFGAKQYEDLKTAGLYGPHREQRGLHPVDARRDALLDGCCGSSKRRKRSSRTRSSTSTFTSTACRSCSSTMLRPAFSPRWATQNAVYLPRLLVDVQHRGRYSVRHGVRHGRGRRRVGDVPLPGRELRAGTGRGVPPVRKDPDVREGRRLLVEPFWAVRRHRHSEHLAAELHFCRQHHHPERHQQLRRRRHGGLFRRREAQQHGHHLADHTRQRHFKLHGAESRRGEI